MATPPWVILGRHILAEHAAVAAPDFTLPVAPPPRVIVVAAGRGAHPDANRPDQHPYIIAAAPDYLLANFAVAPSVGNHFDDDPPDSHLVVLHHFVTAEGRTTAVAESVPDRGADVPNLLNIGSVGIIPHDQGGYIIVDLQVRKGSDLATLAFFISGSGDPDPDGPDPEWLPPESVPSPLPELDRKWNPHGAVFTGTTLWCFDLSWGILSCDIQEGDHGLLFHPLPEFRTLPEAEAQAMQEVVLNRRCVTVSQGQLRYVEIIPVPVLSADGADDGEEVAVSMWTMGFSQSRWAWNYTVKFEQIWNDDSYRATRLPRNVPVLAVVSPSDPNLVYFSLQQRLFGVNMLEHRVVHDEGYDLMMNNPGLEAAGRFVLAWDRCP